MNAEPQSTPGSLVDSRARLLLLAVVLAGGSLEISEHSFCHLQNEGIPAKAYERPLNYAHASFTTSHLD